METKNKYEGVVIFRPQTTLLAEAIFEEKINKIIGCNNITKIDKLGIKRLCYTLKGNEKGYYLVLYFNGDSRIVSELEYYFRKNNSILKFMTIKVED